MIALAFPTPYWTLVTYMIDKRCHFNLHFSDYETGNIFWCLWTMWISTVDYLFMCSSHSSAREFVFYHFKAAVYIFWILIFFICILTISWYVTKIILIYIFCHTVILILCIKKPLIFSLMVCASVSCLGKVFEIYRS